jgi:tyrosinase
MAFWAHGNAQFFPYHRGMLRMFELALQSVGWAKGLIYWDWSAESQDWWNSDVFQYLGTHGTDPDNCLSDGYFSLSKFNVSLDPPTGPNEELRSYSGNPTCLRRCGRIGWALTDAVVIKRLLEQSKTFTEFRGDDRTNYHAIGHIIIGGRECDFGNPSFSPNDPIFWCKIIILSRVLRKNKTNHHVANLSIPRYDR